MQSKILLKSFDTQFNHNEKIDLTAELSRIQREQELIFQKKLSDKEKEIHQRITQELTAKFKTDLKNSLDVINQKYLKDTDIFIEKICEESKIYKENCLSVLTIFINHYVKTLNKQVIHNDIMDNIQKLFKDNPQQKIAIITNTITQDTIKNIPKTDYGVIDYIIDDALPDGDIQLKYLNHGGGVYFSEQTITQTMNDMITNFLQG